MPRRLPRPFAALVACALSSCTAHTPARETGDRTETPPADPAPAPAPAPASIGDGPLVEWRWTVDPDPKFGRWTACVASMCELTLDEDSGVATIRRHEDHDAPPWSVSLDSVFVGQGQLASDARRVYVLRYSGIASGATVHAFDADTGAPLWATALQALGPVGHSQYLNRAQIRADVTEGRVTIYGWELDTRYVEELDAKTGQTLLNGRFAAPLASLPWRWKERPPFSHGQPKTLVLPTANINYTHKGENHGIVRLTPKTPELTAWEYPLSDHGSCGAAEMVAHQDALWLVTYCTIASGAQLTVLDLATGAVRHDRPLIGLGPVDHSKYRNDLQLGVEHGHVIVYGDEAQGRYVEALDPLTARSSSVLVFRD